MSRAPNPPLPSIEHSGDTTVFIFSGGAVRDEEDMLAKELRGHTDGLAGRHLLLDLAHVRGIYSIEIGTLITLHKRLQATGGRLTLLGVGPDVYEVLRVMCLHNYLEIHRTGGDEAPFLPPRPGV
jgi:anti-sigma B factor antagonist